MLSEKKIGALKAGAYGVTRGGNRVRVINVLDNDVALVAVKKSSWEFENYANFPYYNLFNKANDLDIISLWEDRPEPFNLERALAGEPIFNDNVGSGKAYLSKSSFDNETFIVEYKTAVGLYGIPQLNTDFKMWKEPELVKPTADDLPKPIRVFGDLKNVWRFAFSYSFNAYIPVEHSKTNGKWINKDYITLNNGCYYATKEDCQAVCDWLMNR